MQRIMIVSDTHRRITNLAEALYREGNIDKLIHLGDFEGEDEVIRGMAGCEVMFVPGNNDFFSPYDKEIETQIGKYKVLLTHGHYYYVSLEDEIMLINPGSISYPRQADKKCTYIMMEVLDNGEVGFKLKSI